jgi:hypothetical protein
MKYIFDRFKEPSSWAGFAMLATLFGVPATTAQAVIQVVSAVAGVLAIFLPEKSPSA